MNILEAVELVLPSTVQLQPHLDTTKNHFLATFEVNAQLHNITVINRICLAFLRGWTEPNVIQKGPRRTLYILDEPLSIFAPEFAVASADDFALEANGSRRWLVARSVGLRAISFRVSADADDFGSVGQRSGDGWE